MKMVMLGGLVCASKVPPEAMHAIFRDKIMTPAVPRGPQGRNVSSTPPSKCTHEALAATAAAYPNNNAVPSRRNIRWICILFRDNER